jgi:polysaccharide export outer membrane protein/exopolysaccharide production protein ExoF
MLGSTRAVLTWVGAGVAFGALLVGVETVGATGTRADATTLKVQGPAATQAPLWPKPSMDRLPPLSSPGLAGPAQRSATVPSAADLLSETPGLEVAHAERLLLRVYGYPEIAGEYLVGSDRKFAIPGVGRVSVDDISLSELEHQVADRLTALARREISVSIEIVRFRPFYIVGHVTEPGTFEWRPGLNIIQAVALARGVYRPPGSLSDVYSASDRQLQSQQSKTQLRFALAQLARLKAEKEGSDTVSATDRITGLINAAPPAMQPALKSFMDRQNAVLDEQRAALQSQLAGLQVDHDAAIKELETARVQEKAVAGQLEISRSLLKEVEQLKDRQLVANNQYLARRSEFINNEVRHAESRALVERAEARVRTIARQMTTLQHERQAVLNERIETLEREIAQLELAISVSTRSVEDYATPTLRYQVARRSPGGVVTTAMDLFSPVLPGDVVIVSRQAEEGAEDKASDRGAIGVPRPAGALLPPVGAPMRATSAPGLREDTFARRTE